jgi:AhpD family alkylhydroperoxidase
MSHVSAVPFEKIPEELHGIMRGYDEELGGSEFVQVFANAPKVFKSFIDYYFGLVLEARGAVTAELTELVRLMVAKHNDCFLWIHARLAVARQEGLTEEKIAEIGNYEASDMYSASERVALRYAEAIAGDLSSSSAGLFNDLAEYFTDEEVIDLGMRIQTFVGYGRLVRTLDLKIGSTCPIS